MLELTASKPRPSSAASVAQSGRIVDLVPGEMRRDARRRPAELVDHGAVVEFFEDVRSARRAMGNLAKRVPPMPTPQVGIGQREVLDLAP